MRVSKISGLVKEIENVNSHFSLITLLTPEKKYEEETIPVYMNVNEEYLGKWIDVTSYRYGFLFRKFQQRIDGLFQKNVGEELNYSLKGMINKKSPQIKKI